MIRDGNAREKLFGAGLGVLDARIEEPVFVKDAGVDQFVLGVGLRALGVFFENLLVRVRRVRVPVDHLHVRVRRQVVEEEVVLLNVLAVVALIAGQARRGVL